MPTIRDYWRRLRGAARRINHGERMEDLIENFVNLRIWAVVGYSDDPLKYGNRIYHDLSRAGYKVYPVNLKGGTVNGDQVYSSVSTLPEPPQVVDIVVPPSQTELVLKQCLEQGLRRVWLQPGAESPAALEFCRKHGMDVVHDACAMVEKRIWEGY